MRKRTKFLLALTCCLSIAIAGAACKTGNQSTDNASSDKSSSEDLSNSSVSDSSSSIGDSSVTEKALSIEETSVTLEKGTQKTLTVVSVGLEEALTWSSEDENVAIVVNGSVTALAEGSTTITVRADGLSASCQVTVTDATLVPVIAMNDLSLKLGETQALLPSVSYNGATVEATLSWSVGDESMISVEEGQITALKVGSTTLTVTAEYNGKSAYKQVNVNVVEDLQVSFSATKVGLTLVDDVTRTVVATVIEGGEPGTGAISWSSANPEVATVENGVITAAGRGSTTVQFSYTTASAITHYFDIEVVVSPKVVTMEEEVLFDLTDGSLTLTTAKTPVSAKVDGKTLADTTVSGKSITIPSASFGAIGKETKLTVSSLEIDYVYDAILVNGIITTAAEYTQMWAKAEALVEGDNTFGGYWMLGADIDMSETDTYGYGNVYSDQNLATYGFLGTFNGNGYAFRNVGLTNWASLFGIVGNTGVIKNVSVIGLRPIAGGAASAPIAVALHGTIENVYVEGEIYSLNSKNNPQSGLVFSIKSGAKIRNCIVNVKSAWETGDQALTAFGYLHRSDTQTDGDFSGIENCYAISGATEKCVIRTAFMQQYGDGECALLPEGFLDGRNVKIYAAETESAAIAALNADTDKDLSAFNDGEFWLSDGNMPTTVRLYGLAWVDAPDQAFMGGSATFKANKEVVFTVKENGADVRISEDGVLSVGNVTEGTTITVIATSLRYPKVSIEKTVILRELVKDSEEVRLGKLLKSDLGDGMTLPAGQFGDATISAVIYNGERISDSATIPYSVLANLSGNVTLWVESAEAKKMWTNVTVLLVDGVITTVEEFNAMWTSAEALAEGDNTYGGYWELGADLDFTDVTYFIYGTQGGQYWDDQNRENFGFMGTFDGCGYKLMNINQMQNASVFGVIAKGGVVKNLSIVNVTGQSAGFVPLANVLWGAVENIYVEAFISGQTAASAPQSGLVQLVQSGATINNVVAVVAGTWTKDYLTAVGYLSDEEGADYSKISNVYVISGGACAFDCAFKTWTGTTQTAVTAAWNEERNVKIYTGATASEAVTAYAEDETKDVSSFEKDDLWLTCDSVYPVFASAYSLTWTNAPTSIIAGNSLTFTVSDDVTFSIATQLDGVTISENGVLTVSKETASGNVTITAISKKYPTYYVTVEVSVRALENVDMEVALGRKVKSDLGAGLDVTSDVYGGATISAVYTKDGNKIADGAVISAEKLANLSGNVTLIVESIVSGKVWNNVTVLLVDGVITTVEEYTAMWTAAETLVEGDQTYGGYWELGADLDFNSTYVYTMDTAVNLGSTQGWLGTFDGRGHMIKNYCFDQVHQFGGLFCSIGRTGVVKNLAVSCVLLRGHNVGTITSKLWGTIENVYVETALCTPGGTDGQAGVAHNVYSGATMNNVIAVMQAIYFEDVSRSMPALGMFNIAEGDDYSKITNCYAVAYGGSVAYVGGVFMQRNGIWGSPVTTEIAPVNSGLYTGSTEAEARAAFANADPAANIESFTSDVWLTSGTTLPVMKSAYGFAFTDGLEVVYNGKTVAFTTNRDATITAEGLPEGVTINGGVLSVPSDLSSNARITVIAISTTYPDLVIEKTVDLRVILEDATAIDLGTAAKMTATTTDGTAVYAGADIVLSSDTIGEISAVYTAEGTLLSNSATIPYSAISAYSGAISLKVESIANEKLYTNVSVFLVDGVITTLAEWKAMWPAAETLVAGDNTYGGYWTLGCNVDLNQEIVTVMYGSNGMGDYSSEMGWLGTFDGCGYTLSNYVSDVQSNGGGNWTALFGSIGKTGVVKNLALQAPLVRGHGTSALAAQLYGTIENVYVSAGLATPGADAGQGVINFIQSGATLRNVVVVNAALYLEDNSSTGVIGNLYYSSSPDYSNIENCYAIGYGGSYSYLLGAFGHKAGYWGKPTADTLELTNCKSYIASDLASAIAAFTADAEKDISCFEGGYWTIGGDGIPTIQSL